jgi:hypothetical protein
MNYRIFLFFVMLLVAQMSFCQKISFEKSILNVGATIWRKPITAVFQFENKGRDPLIVEEVDAGCGCMDVKWTKGLINKGIKGEISITYDALLLGSFDRVINVYTNCADKPEQIRIKGKVLQKIDEDVKNKFPYQIGDILLSTGNVEFPDVHRGDSATVSFDIFNNSNEVYTPQLMHLPSYITAEYNPSMLGRGRRGVITLKLNSDNMDNVGIYQTNVYLARYSGDRVGNDNDIAITSVLLPKLEKSAGAFLNPKLHLSSNVIDMGKLGRKSRLTGKVFIANKGTDTLILESIAVYNQALTVSLPKRSLLPGESMKMKVILNSKYSDLSNVQSKVLIITNDAEHQKETITVKFDK